MGILEIILAGLSLAMDAFAVSVSKGLTLKQIDYKKALLTGLYFGFSQFIMPVIGYFVGSSFIQYIQDFDHYIAFAILLLIGLNMIKESFSKEEANPDFSFKIMIVLALATSIDALTMGLTFSMTGIVINIFLACLIIGVITFILSFGGVIFGNLVGSKFQKAAQILGGVVLILLGVKVLLEGLQII